MGIEAIKIRGHGRVYAVCDRCQHRQEERAKYETTGTGPGEPQEGAVIKRLQSEGWDFVKRRLYCPTCAADRRPSKAVKAAQGAAQKIDTLPTAPPAPPAPPPEPSPPEPSPQAPTRAHKRQILQMLDVVYDAARVVYLGGDSDHSVAQAVGGGVTAATVAAIRDAFYGAGGANEDVLTLTADLGAYVDHARAKVDAIKEAHGAALAAISKAHAEALSRATSDLQRAENYAARVAAITAAYATA